VARLPLVALLSLVFGSCGGPTTAGQGWTAYGPPATTLVSRAGVQHAVQGSSCVHGSGSGRCADSTYPYAKKLSVVRPGETVRIRIAGSKGIEVTLHPLGCPKRVVGRAKLGPGGAWRVTARPGLYQVEVFSRFSGNGVSGDTSAGLGLWVDRSHRLEIVAAKRVYGPRC
jgi:hypothetical protein